MTTPALIDATPHADDCPRFVSGGPCTCDRDMREMRRVWPSAEEPPPFFAAVTVFLAVLFVCLFGFGWALLTLVQAVL